MRIQPEAFRLPKKGEAFGSPWTVLRAGGFPPLSFNCACTRRCPSLTGPVIQVVLLVAVWKKCPCLAPGEKVSEERPVR
eukprot:2286587-Pyramimonas_sp.AAC.1